MCTAYLNVPMSVTGSRLQYTSVQPTLNVPMSVTGSSLQYTAVQPNLNGPAVPGDLMPVRVDVLAEGVADREPLLSQNGVGCGTLASLRFPHHHQPHLPERGQFSSVQFRSRWYLCALKSPYVLYHVSRKFSPLCLPTVTMFIWLTMDFSRPFKEDRRALPLSTPLSSRWSMVWYPWLCART